VNNRRGETTSGGRKKKFVWEKKQCKEKGKVGNVHEKVGVFHKAGKVCWGGVFGNNAGQTGKGAKTLKEKKRKGGERKLGSR